MGRPDYGERNREGRVGMVNRPKHGPSVRDSLPIVHALLHVLLGDVGVGKSSLVLPFVKGQFVEFQGYCDFLTEEKLLQAVEVGQVVTSFELPNLGCTFFQGNGTFETLNS
ncbi:hypothetical protein FF1_010515 [Malus domestica]